MEQVVVTGIGAVTAHGVGVEPFWRNIIAGRVAIRPVQRLDLTGYRTGLGGEVTANPPAGRDPALEFAITAAREALARSGLWPGRVPVTQWGVILGTCNAGLRTAERAWRAGSRDWRRYRMILPQVLAETLGAEFGFLGPVLSVNTACASAAHAIAHATEMLRAGRADAMLAGGTDALTETAFAGFNALEALAPGPAAPYSKHREGLSLGEGAGMLVLTTRSIALAAGAPILAEVLGYGLSADGYHPTTPHPEGEGAARAITATIAGSGLSTEDVHYINGHGTGTPKNDAAESNAVRRALGDRIPLSSTKSMIGHLLGAAGAVEGIATVLALRDQIAPPTAGFTEPDPRCGLDPIPGTGRPMRMDVALSNSFAFGGANATIAFGQPGRFTVAAKRPDEDVVVTGVSDVDTDPAGIVPPRQARRLDRLSLLAVAAARRALDDAKLDLDAHNGDRVGVIVGTDLGPVESLERFAGPVLDHGPAAANPAVFPNTVTNAAAGHIAMLLGARGPTSTLTTGAATLCVAEDLLRAGHADALLCVAADDPTPLARRIYPGRLTGGGVALVLERRSAADARGARIRGVLAGHGIAFGADGNERAKRAAVEGAEQTARRRLLGLTTVPIHQPMLGVGALRAAALAIGKPSPVLITSRTPGGTHIALILVPDKDISP